MRSNFRIPVHQLGAIHQNRPAETPQIFYSISWVISLVFLFPSRFINYYAIAYMLYFNL